MVQTTSILNQFLNRKTCWNNYTNNTINNNQHNKMFPNDIYLRVIYKKNY